MIVFCLAENGDLKLSAAQRFVEFGGRGVDELDADPGVTRAHAGDKLNQISRRDRAHHAQPKLSLLQVANCWAPCAARRACS